MKKNRNRYSQTPIKRKNGRSKTVTDDSLTAIQLDTLECIFRNPYITAEQLSNALGRDIQNVRRNLTFFYSSPVGFIEICIDDLEDRNDYRPRHWLITDLGIAHLRLRERISLGIRRPRAQPLKHEFMITHGMVSLEAGARKNPITTFHGWEEIRTRDFVPRETANDLSPFATPCTTEAKASTANPDNCIFSIALTEPYAKERFIAFEADRGTKNRAQMTDQLLGWLDVIRNETYTAHYGVKRGSFFVLFLVRNHDQTDRIKWLQDIVLELTDGKGSKAIAFQKYEPTAELDYVFTRDWLRAGHAPINLSQ